jgi:hypothetical protein
MEAPKRVNYQWPLMEPARNDCQGPPCCAPAAGLEIILYELPREEKQDLESCGGNCHMMPKNNVWILLKEMGGTSGL